jgi:hypothetical protein
MIVEFANPIVETRFAMNGKIVKRVQGIVESVLIRRYAEMQHVMAKKHAIRVLGIVEIVRHQIPIVGMELAMVRKIAMTVQKIVGRVLHHRNLFAETAHVMTVKHVVIAQGIVRVHVNAWMEKFEMKPMCA